MLNLHLSKLLRCLQFVSSRTPTIHTSNFDKAYFLQFQLLYSLKTNNLCVQSLPFFNPIIPIIQIHLGSEVTRSSVPFKSLRSSSTSAESPQRTTGSIVANLLISNRP